MLIVYIIILTLFIANINKFIKIFLKNGFVNSNFKLNTFVEPILRVFNAYKYKKYDIIYHINQ